MIKFRNGSFDRISRILGRFSSSVTMALHSQSLKRYSKASGPNKVNNGHIDRPEFKAGHMGNGCFRTLRKQNAQTVSLRNSRSSQGIGQSVGKTFLRPRMCIFPPDHVRLHRPTPDDNAGSPHLSQTINSDIVMIWNLPLKSIQDFLVCAPVQHPPLLFLNFRFSSAHRLRPCRHQKADLPPPGNYCDWRCRK